MGLIVYLHKVMFNTKYRYGFIVLIALYSYWNTIFSEVYRYYGIIASWYAVIVVFIFLAALIWEGSRLLEKIFRILGTVPGNIRSRVLFFIISIVYSSLASLALIYSAGHWIYGMHSDQLRISLKLGLTLGTRINLFLQVVNNIFFFLRQYRDKLLETEELKRAGAQAQLQAIKNQVNPHFLFNNLNVLASMVIQENPEANKFIEEFSTVYRHVLNSQQKELVPVREELEFIRHYIFLLNKRFPESIFVEIKVDPVYEEYYVIPVALQMLIENAIKHNRATRTHPLYINLYVNEKSGLVVENNLQLRPSVEDRTQIGLKNISQRYELISQKNIEILDTGDHFYVILPLIQPII